MRDWESGRLSRSIVRYNAWTDEIFKDILNYSNRLGALRTDRGATAGAEVNRSGPKKSPAKIDAIRGR